MEGMVKVGLPTPFNCCGVDRPPLIWIWPSVESLSNPLLLPTHHLDGEG